MESLTGLFSQDFLQDYGPQIQRLSGELEPRLKAWAISTGIRRDVSFSRLALTVSATAPFASLETLEAPAKCGLVVIALDDLFDDPSVSQRDLRRRLVQVQSALFGEPVPDYEPAGRAIAGLRNELSGYRLFQSLHHDWLISFSRMIEGMRRERLLVPTTEPYVERDLPSFTEYMGYARYSIGIPLYAMTGAITIGDGSVLDRMPEFCQLAEAAGYAARLANDVATRKREKNEKTVNAVSLRCREEYGACTENQMALVEESIRADIIESLQHCRRLAPLVQTASGRPEEFVLNLATVVCAFYGIGDY